SYRSLGKIAKILRENRAISPLRPYVRSNFSHSGQWYIIKGQFSNKRDLSACLLWNEHIGKMSRFKSTRLPPWERIASG
ncbi:MAG: hypothetical protein KDE31_31075, partial [Caldilineaceae bacterium]|nr:hypothetical protein [Caldilineaceae bacterium]